MRKVLIGLSITFLVLSGFITLKAVGLPTGVSVSQPAPVGEAQKRLSPEVDEILGRFAKEQKENRVKVQQLEATISKLEDKLSSSKEAAKSLSANVVPQKRVRVLGVIGDGEFHPGQDGMSEAMARAIDAFASDILQFPDLQVIVEGHTDKTPIRSPGGRYADNLDLSFLRAKAVARLLEKRGVPPERISVVGYGDTRPIASNETEEGKAKNRRVEIKLTAKDKES